MPVNTDEKGVADRYESPLSYHALFDIIKVDVFERSSLLNTDLKPISPLSIPAVLEDPLSEDEPESESLIGPDDSVSVMGDLGDPNLGSNFGSQFGTRAQGEEMVREFMYYFGDAARSTSEESGKPVRVFADVYETDSTNWSTMETIREVSNLSAAFFDHGWRILKMEFVWSVLFISCWQNSITDPILLPTSPSRSPRQRSKSNPHASTLPDHRHRSSPHHVCASFHEVRGCHCV
ncbi:hypothetical protein BC829DRAFT_396355 [Chytridium lagenaria]|nr:hypothetical protein BC829DRAFT_396355 [Chytridium lagenaria]